MLHEKPAKKWEDQAKLVEEKGENQRRYLES